MERDSIVYQFRRKLQVIAHKIFSDEFMSKLYFRIVLNERLDLKNPKTFNEKLQHYKLNYCKNNLLIIQGSDKYAVREYVKSKGLEHILNNIYGVWEFANEISWNRLPDKFVLKCNHGCGYNLLCADKGNFDIEDATRRLNKWMSEDFGAFNIETFYSEIESHKIICEEYLGAKIIDYKFFCFNGEPKFYYVSSDLIHDRQAKIGFYEMDGKKIPLIRNDYEDFNVDKMPEFFKEMVENAKKLSEDFPFVRVDFFIANNTYYFAELTFVPAAGMMPINPKKYDYQWGGYLDFNQKMGDKK